MPTVDRGDARLVYAAAGDGSPVVMVGDAGMGPWALSWQYGALAGPYRAVALPLRGAGESTVREPSISLDALVADLRAVVKDADIGTPSLVGVGVGGLVALAYSLRHRVRTLTVLGGAARGSVFAPGAYPGIASLDGLVSTGFQKRQPSVTDQIREWRHDEDAPSAVRDAHLRAIDGVDLEGDLHECTAPAKVFHGGRDEIVDRAAGRSLAKELPRGSYTEYDAAAHLVGIERSRPVNDAIEGLLAAQTN